jgi:hypothetical protein
LLSAQELQRRDQEFQAQLNAINIIAAERSQKEERRVKQKIEFQNNVTQLLLKDDTGDLAQKLVKATSENSRMFEDAHDGNDGMMSFLQNFLGRYISHSSPQNREAQNQ